MEERDLEHVLACSPDLHILALSGPSRVQISSDSLRCLLLWSSMTDELAVVDAPRLQRLILYAAESGRTMKVQIGYAPELTVLGYLETATHVLVIGNTIITSIGGESGGQDNPLNSIFWRVIAAIECVESCLKKLVLDEFRGGDNELGFLKLVFGRAQVLQKAVVVLPDAGNSAMMAKEDCPLVVLAHAEPGDHVWSYNRASDLSLSDPFLGNAMQ
ncbi:hypothetical protein ACQ4PT_002023 [Festuca glaucescens]